MSDTTIRSNGGKSRSRVLTVDDDPDVAESFKMLLEIIGSEVRVAHDGPAALEVARRFRPEVVFIDINLPGMSGYELARRLRREHGTGLHLVALTGFGQNGVGERARKAGFDRHLLKPVDLELLQELLRTRAHDRDAPE